MLSRHAELSRELAASLRQLGEIRAHVIKIHAEAWTSHGGLNVTERREVVKVATSHWAGEEARLVGEVEALRVELNHVEVLLAHGDAES